MKTAEALTRSGIGKLTLVDLDEVCVTNTNRQIHALEGAVGKAKVDELAARISKINPECEVITHQKFFTEETAESILEGGFSYLVDAIDGLSNKCLMIAQCQERGIPIITCGAAGGRRDGTAVRVADLNRAKYDKLFSNPFRGHVLLLLEPAGFDGDKDGPWPTDHVTTLKKPVDGRMLISTLSQMCQQTEAEPQKAATE